MSLFGLMKMASGLWGRLLTHQSRSKVSGIDNLTINSSTHIWIHRSVYTRYEWRLPGTRMHRDSARSALVGQQSLSKKEHQWSLFSTAPCSRFLGAIRFGPVGCAAHCGGTRVH